MRAIVQEKYGAPAEVLSLREIATPSPGVGQVLVRVRAASVHTDVWHVVWGIPYALRCMGSGVLRPTVTVPGTDLAGVVEAVGGGSSRFRVGDAVFGEVVASHQWTHGGAFAEYAVVPEERLALMPERVTFEEAACVPTSGLIALRTLRQEGQLRSGQEVLINGAGGAVGLLAVQLALAFGAVVTAVDHGSKRELLASQGAVRFLDYEKDEGFGLGQRYDLILDVASTLSLEAAKRSLAPTGRYVLVGHAHFDERRDRVWGSLGRFLGLALRSLVDRQLPPLQGAGGDGGGIALLRELMEKGLLRPVVARTYPLDEAVEALRVLATERLAGRVVLVP